MAQTNVQAFSGDVAISSNLAVSGSKFTYDNTNTTVFTGTTVARANEIGYLDMSTSSSANNIHVKIYIKFGQGSGMGDAEYSFHIRPDGANLSLIYDYRNQGGSITPVVYRTNANDLHSGGTAGVVRFGYSISYAQSVIWRAEVSQRSNNVTFYPTNTGSAVVTTDLVQVTPAPFSRFDSNVAVDTNTLFVDSVANRVGIGTDSPTSNLHVVGDVAISSDLAVRRAITIVNSEDTGFSNVVALSIQAKSSDYTSITNGYGSRIQFRTNRGTSGGGVSASADIKGYIYSGAGGGADYHGLDINVYGDNTSLNKGISILSTYGSGSPATTIMHGTVGIGVSPTYKLHVNGSLFYSSGGLNGSDDRIKYNEENITNALDIICKLKPQKYEKIMVFPSDATGSWIPTDENWETVKNAETKPWEGFTHGDEYGFIAQDVRNIPEVSFLVSGSEMKTVDESVSPEEYVNLNEDEQGTYTRKYVYEENVITIEEYTNLISENKDKCTGIYIKQVETQTPLGLNYQGIFVVAVKAIQEIDAQLQAEKVRNDALEARILALESA